MTTLPTAGQVTYGNYTFDGSAHVEVDSSRISDEAERTIVAFRHSITVSATVASGDGSDVSLNLQVIRASLCTDGRVLIFKGLGFGSPLIINTGIQQDIMWGPKTELIAWNPIGSYGAAEVVWRVEVHMPADPISLGSGSRFTGIMAFNYEQDTEIDQHGDTRRTISGYVQIAQTRQGGSRTPSDCADVYLEQFPLQPLSGFKRDSQKHHLSKDKSRMDFVYVDSQIPSNTPWPINVTDIKGNHSVHWSRGGSNTMSYRNIIAMEITPQANLSGTVAWNIFGAIVGKRIQAAQQSASSGGRSAILIDDLFADEDLWGRACNFRVGFRNLRPIADFLGDNGLWTPVKLNTWDQWQTSLQNSMFAQRGNFGLFNAPAMDAIVDLAGGTPTLPSYPTSDSFVTRGRTPTFTNQTPTPGASYIKYEVYVSPIISQSSSRQKTLQAPAAEQPQSDMTGTGGLQFVLPSAGSSASSSSVTPDTIVQRGIPSMSVLFSGSAIRAGYPVPRPALTTVGGVNTVLREGDCPQVIKGNFFGVPVYEMRWSFLYDLPSLAQLVSPPDNIQEGVFNGQAYQPTS